MARLRRPSLREINIYNKLVEQQNKVRRQLIAVHKRNEEASGAGRLPALIIPKRARKIRSDMFFGIDRFALKRRLRAFWDKYHEAKALFGQGLKSYIARTVKEGYMELWREQILDKSGESPNSKFVNTYSKEQIENSQMGSFMEVYNSLYRLSPEVFLALLYSGKIISFKFIYQDMISGTGDKENSWLSQQAELLAMYKSPKVRMELLKTTSEALGTHTKNTMRKAKKAMKEDEERAERKAERKARQAEKAKGGK